MLPRSVERSGSGKTYAAKGFVERLLDSGARVTIVDPLGVWWGLRASADGTAPGFPVIVFGGKHADVPITAEMGAALGHLVATQPLVSIVEVPTIAIRRSRAWCGNGFETRSSVAAGSAGGRGRRRSAALIEADAGAVIIGRGPGVNVGWDFRSRCIR